MLLNLLEAGKLLKLPESKLSKVLPVALKDIEEIIQHLKAYEVLDLPDGNFFCEMRCRKGIHVTIKVTRDILEWENVFCHNHCRECIDKYTFCVNFGILTEYRLYKLQKSLYIYKLQKSLEKMERTMGTEQLEAELKACASIDERVFKENLMP